MAYTNSTQYSPTVQGIACFNGNSVVDKTMISFSMWKTTIKISIYPLIESSSDGNSYANDQPKYDRKNALSIYLTPNKAHMFAELLKKFKQDPASVYGKGVPSGQNMISIEDPTNPNGMNKPAGNPCIVIRKINNESGMVESTYAYELSDELSIVIEDYNPNTGAFTKNLDLFKNHEVDMIILQLEQYAMAMTNAQAFAVNEVIYPHMEKLASKLGVDLSNNSYSSYRNTSYFSNNMGSTDASASTGSSNVNLNAYTGGGLESMMSE